MPPFKLNQSKNTKLEKCTPNINALNEFPELCKSVKTKTEPIKSWANIIKNDENDNLYNSISDKSNNIKKVEIDYFEDDIHNIFDNKYNNIYYNINDKIEFFCNTNALPIYNTYSKIFNLMELIKNYSSELNTIIHEYDNDEEDEYELEEDYESDATDN